MSDVPNLMGELEELRKAGFTLEMDDFGSGYSSLNTLKDINVDVLKFDMGFIKETKNVKKSRIIVVSVISIFRLDGSISYFFIRPANVLNISI